MLRKNNSPDVLIIDADHCAYRAFYAHQELRTSDGVLSGAFYGFLSIIKKQMNTTAPKRIILAWSARNSGNVRKAIYPDYKKGRHHHDTYFTQATDLQKFFAFLGWEQVYNNEGYETDDVIATLSQSISHNTGQQVIILSGDLDFMQLVNDNVVCLVPGNSKKPDVFYTREKVIERWGVPPEQIADLYSLTGDESDNIVGLPLFGEKTASKLLQENGPIKTWFNKMDFIHASPKQIATLKENKDRLLLNKRLISLKNSNVDVSNLSATYTPDFAGDIFEKYKTESMTVMGKYQIRKFTIEDFKLDA